MKYLLLVLFCLLISCKKSVKEGRVYDKNFIPAHEVETVIAVPVGETMVLMPQVHWKEDTYIVFIEYNKDSTYYYIELEDYKAINLGNSLSYR